MPRTELKLEFLSVAGINSFIANTSSPRAVMDYSHFSAHLPILTPDEKIVKSGIEYELGKYINDVKTDHDCIVKAVIPRYKEFGVDEVPTYTLLVEYEKDGDIFLDFIDVNSHNTAHTFFGYKLYPTDELNNITYNSPLAKDTILARTDSLGKNNSYKYGLNANVAFMSHPSVADDGFVISESFAQRAKFTSIIKRVINITKDTIPVNLYGTSDTFKFIPDIGENVRADGLLCALRERNDWFSISDLNNTNISEVDSVFDNLTYVNPNSKVIDIKITRGNYAKQEFPAKMTEQLDQYANMLNNYYSNVVKKYEQIVNEKKIMYGSASALRITPRLHRFITDSMIKVNFSTHAKNKLCYRKLPIDQYRIEITTISTITPKEGVKFSDVHAAKGVVCRILPDHAMPVDKNGNRADVITDSTSTISRMNLGRSYESYLGAFSRDNRQHLIHYFNTRYGSGSLFDVIDTDLAYFKQYIRGMYSLINSDMVEFIDSLNRDELVNHLNEIINDNLYIYYPPDNENNITDVITNIEKSIYKPLNDKVTYIDELNRQVETVDNIRIGQLYFMVLEKINNTYSAVSSSKVNNFGFPIKGPNTNKSKYPHSLTPAKILGETEVRILISFASPELVGELIDLSLNPVSHKFMVKSILEGDKAFDTNFNIDRSIVPYGQTKSLKIMHHIFNAAGFQLQFEEENA